MVDPFVLQTESIVAFFDFAYRSAIKVSIVSPDCDIGITNVFLSRLGSRYRYSEANSTSTGIFPHFSIAYLPTNPALYAVPHAIITILLNFLNLIFKFKPANLPINVSAIAFGCSYISLSIKCGNPPRSAAVASHEISNSFPDIFCPVKSVTSIESGVISTTWSWPSSRAFLVYEMKAATSDARKFSPTPIPTTSGELRLEPTI